MTKKKIIALGVLAAGCLVGLGGPEKREASQVQALSAEETEETTLTETDGESGNAAGTEDNLADVAGENDQTETTQETEDTGTGDSAGDSEAAGDRDSSSSIETELPETVELIPTDGQEENVENTEIPVEEDKTEDTEEPSSAVIAPAVGYNQEEASVPAVYQGIDYSPVYNYAFYVQHYSDLQKLYGDGSEKSRQSALEHFVLCGMKEGRQGSSTFDVKSYRNEYVDLRRAFGKDLPKYYRHYITSGEKEHRKTMGVSTLQNPETVRDGIDYRAIYDYSYYLSRYPDLAKVYDGDDEGALSHFLYCGEKEGRQGSASFEFSSYWNLYQDLRVAFGKNRKLYYDHYLRSGIREGRRAVGQTELINPITRSDGIDYSPVYNYQYYLGHYRDLAAVYHNDDIDALGHFLTCGIREGRQASPDFSINSYQMEYLDLRVAFRGDAAKYVNHYLTCGRKEHRKATGTTELKNPATVYDGTDYSRVYSYQYYSSRYPDLKKIYKYDDVGMLEHFILCGMKEGRMGCPDFQATSYRNRYQDLRLAFRGDMKGYAKHFMATSQREHRKATGCSTLQNILTKWKGTDYTPVYDYQYYQNHNYYVKQNYENDDVSTLEYFVNQGMQVGDQAKASFNVWYYSWNYDDLYLTYGENNTAYYQHYINKGRREGRVADRPLYDMNPTKISNSGHDERGGYMNGAAGDQDGSEWHVIDWYSRPWTCVLRHPDPNVRETLARLSEEAANNDHIGYDMNQRTSYWFALANAGCSPASIWSNCEADCSSGVSSNVRATGLILGVPALSSMPYNATTYTMRRLLTQRGFQLLTGPMYTDTYRFLKRGDILLNDLHHVAVNVTDGHKPL